MMGEIEGLILLFLQFRVLVMFLAESTHEFSFKEMRMWGQPIISSCCLCVRCESKELRGRGVQDS